MERPATHLAGLGSYQFYRSGSLIYPTSKGKLKRRGFSDQHVRDGFSPSSNPRQFQLDVSLGQQSPEVKVPLSFVVFEPLPAQHIT